MAELMGEMMTELVAELLAELMSELKKGPCHTYSLLQISLTCLLAQVPGPWEQTNK